jgi:glycerol kinase
LGLTQGAGRAHLARAALEAMAYQTQDVLGAMQTEAHLSLEVLRVDGGVSRSAFLVQFLANLLNVPVVRSEHGESTALGAAYLAGLAVGFWDSPQVIAALPEKLERFEPRMSQAQRQDLYEGWRLAVERIRLSASQPQTALV